MDLAYSIAHYFYPRHSNNHKARFLHSSSLIIVVFLLIVYQVFLQVFPLFGVQILGYAANISPSEIVELTNNKRAEAGASSLVYNLQLELAAREKGKHMLENDYWAHVAPDGTEPWAFFVDAGYKYRYAGENLARDFSNPQDAVDAWMASPTHKDNLLSTKYSEIGVAVVEGDLGGVEATIIVQLFGTQLTDTTPETPIAEAAAQVSAEVTATLTVSPTPAQVPAAVAQVTPTIFEQEIVKLPEAAQEERGGLPVLISPFNTTRAVSLVTIVSLLVIMVIDGVVTWRKRTPRVGGRTFAHLAFLGMILAIVMIARAGKIL